MTAFSDVLEARLSRRDWLRGAGALSLFAGLSSCATGARGMAPALTFTPIGPSAEDDLRVPPEYVATVLFRWGDPVGAAAGMPEFRLDASNSAADQDLQAGMHHDGMHFFPLPGASGSARGFVELRPHPGCGLQRAAREDDAVADFAAQRDALLENRR